MQFGSDKSQLAKYKWFEIMFIFQPSIKLAKNQCNCNFFFFFNTVLLLFKAKRNGEIAGSL